MIQSKVSIIFTLILMVMSCDDIKKENEVLIIARRSDEPVFSKNGDNTIKYYWKRKLFRATKPFDARYSNQYDYFLIYIDRTNPLKWQTFKNWQNGFSDTMYIPDSLRKKIFIDTIDFGLLEQER